ncbi:hypothetical protein GGI43DRAFT_350988 [Trichoderma evansii]
MPPSANHGYLPAPRQYSCLLNSSFTYSSSNPFLASITSIVGVVSVTSCVLVRICFIPFSLQTENCAFATHPSGILKQRGCFSAIKVTILISFSFFAFKPIRGNEWGKILAISCVWGWVCSRTMDLTYLSVTSVSLTFACSRNKTKGHAREKKRENGIIEPIFYVF